MNKKNLLRIMIFMFFFILIFCVKSYAENLDEIVNYVVTVDPRMNDGTLDITYEFTWKVLDSEKEGPLQWVQIGTANYDFDTVTALTPNIKTIYKDNGSYVSVYFNKKYYKGEQVTFKYKIHQSYISEASWGNVKYSFTPAWFTNAEIDNLTVKWNMDSVKSSNSTSKENNYLVWNKKFMKNGEKLKIKVKYKKSAFSSLTKMKQTRSIFSLYTFMPWFIAIIVAFISNRFGGGGYFGHGGFYGGYGYRNHYYGGCVSSCACASSCASSCACACAGSGRAGCSKKDFYGTKISKDKLNKVFK